MGTAEDYRKRALDAEASAALTEDTILRQGFLDLAKQWRALADRRDGKTKPKPEPD